MSRTAQSPGRSLLAAAHLALAGLAAPLATAQAQSLSPERALLNTIPVAYRVVVVGNESNSPASDGNRALLGRWTAGAQTGPSLAFRSQGEAYNVTGEQALLGRPVPPAQRRLTLAW